LKNDCFEIREFFKDLYKTFDIELQHFELLRLSVERAAKALSVVKFSE
jgi:hypothetical protein